MKKRPLILFFTLIFGGFTSPAQVNSLADSFKILLKHPPNDSLEARWNNSLFGLYLNIDMDSALYFAEQAKQIGERIQDQRLLASNMLNYGSYYWYKSDFPKAMKSYTEAASIFEELGIETDVADARNNIATIYLVLGELDKAQPYFQSATKIYQRNSYNSGLVSSWHYLAYILESKQVYDSAIYYWNKSLALAKKLNFITQQAWANSGLGEAHKNLGEYAKARNYQIESLRLEKLQGNTVGILQSYIELGSLEKELGNFQNAENYFAKANAMGHLKNDFISQSHLFQEYVDLYEKQGNIAMAYESFKKLAASNDSLKNSDNRSKIEELNEKYESKKKENEIITLQKDNQLAALILDKEKNQKFIFGIASLIFLILTSVMFFGYLQIKKSRNLLDSQNKIITQFNEELTHTKKSLTHSNQTKDKLFALVAHDLRGPITSLNGIGMMLTHYHKKGEMQKVEELIQHVDKASGSVNHLLDNLLKWALSQTEQLKFEPVIFSLRSLIEDCQEAFLEVATAKGISIESNVHSNLQIKADYNMVSTVIRNLVSNAIKFSPSETKVMINVLTKEENVLIEVKDMGNGIPEQTIEHILKNEPSSSTLGTRGEKGTGLGLTLCKEFIEFHGEELAIRLPETGGTVISFHLPLA